MRNKEQHPLLSLQNICAGYGKKDVIKNVNINFYPGRLYALLGLNGSGKTTLLKAICTLIPLSEGSVVSAQTDIAKLSVKERARYISYIPQRHSKLIGITVLDAVTMGLNASLGIFEHVTERQKTEATKALEKMGVSQLANDDFSRLSEGQKQLVILARALAQNSPVMLMDEPDSALDFTNKHKILKQIRDIILNENKTGIITLHDPNLAISYCDCVILIKNGEIAAQINTQNAKQEEITDKLSIIYDKDLITRFCRLF